MVKTAVTLLSFLLFIGTDDIRPSLAAEDQSISLSFRSNGTVTMTDFQYDKLASGLNFTGTQQRGNFSPCWFEGDGCTACWYDYGTGSGEWHCPNFCGEGRTFAGTATIEDQNSTSPFIAQTCSVDSCGAIQEDSCLGFGEEWTCPDLCVGRYASTTSQTGMINVDEGEGDHQVLGITPPPSAEGTYVLPREISAGIPAFYCREEYGEFMACIYTYDEEVMDGCTYCYSAMTLSASQTCTDLKDGCSFIQSSCDCGDCHRTLLAWIGCEAQPACSGFECGPAEEDILLDDMLGEEYSFVVGICIGVLATVFIGAAVWCCCCGGRKRDVVLVGPEAGAAPSQQVKSIQDARPEETYISHDDLADPGSHSDATTEPETPPPMKQSAQATHTRVEHPAEATQALEPEKTCINIGNGENTWDGEECEV